MVLINTGGNDNAIKTINDINLTGRGNVEIPEGFVYAGTPYLKLTSALAPNATAEIEINLSQYGSAGYDYIVCCTPLNHNVAIFDDVGFGTISRVVTVKNCSSTQISSGTNVARMSVYKRPMVSSANIVTNSLLFLGTVGKNVLGAPELPTLGTAGQVLTVNSGATGVEWTTPSTVTIDQTPTSGSNNAVSSGGTYTALSSKQDTLVSGTSIKTVNSTSLLGSGDVAVQPTLVSGTNIKTINNESILGSGNISVGGLGVNFGKLRGISLTDVSQSFSTTSSTTSQQARCFNIQCSGVKEKITQTGVKDGQVGYITEDYVDSSCFTVNSANLCTYYSTNSPTTPDEFKNYYHLAIAGDAYGDFYLLGYANQATTTASYSCTLLVQHCYEQYCVGEITIDGYKEKVYQVKTPYASCRPYSRYNGSRTHHYYRVTFNDNPFYFDESYTRHILIEPIENMILDYKEYAYSSSYKVYRCNVKHKLYVYCYQPVGSSSSVPDAKPSYSIIYPNSFSLNTTSSSSWTYMPIWGTSNVYYSSQSNYNPVLLVSAHATQAPRISFSSDSNQGYSLNSYTKEEPGTYSKPCVVVFFT